MTGDARDQFEQWVGELRPKLHRYCARMTGAAVDGEDIVQDTLIKALAAMPNGGVIDNPEGWLFRIAHNTALDFLRRRTRAPMIQHEKALDMIAASDSPDQDHEVATMSLRPSCGPHSIPKRYRSKGRETVSNGGFPCGWSGGGVLTAF